MWQISFLTSQTVRHGGRQCSNCCYSNFLWISVCTW
jgi:hypothetical protein